MPDDYLVVDCSSNVLGPQYEVSYFRFKRLKACHTFEIQATQFSGKDEAPNGSLGSSSNLGTCVSEDPISNLSM